MKLDVFSLVVETLYEAALNPTEWPRAAHLFARLFDAESSAIFQRNLAEGSANLLGITDNFDAKAMSEYEAYYHQKDLWAIAMSKLASGQPMLGSEIVDEGEYLNSEIFDGYARRLGICQLVGSVITLEKPYSGVIAIHRPLGARAFGTGDKRNLAMLLPHVSRAMMLHRRLGGLTLDNRISIEALEKLSIGMIAVAADATVLFANPMAERLLRAGLGLVCRQGCLGATDPVKDSNLRHAIRQAGLASIGKPSEAGGVLALPRLEGRPLSLLVCPLRPHALTLGPSVPAALVIFGDPDDSPSTSPQALIDLYGLTRAEAKLMTALVNGERLENYAERRQISIHTARVQLKQVFAKTGHSRQADLIREALANLALRAASRTPRDR